MVKPFHFTHNGVGLFPVRVCDITENGKHNDRKVGLSRPPSVERDVRHINDRLEPFRKSCQAGFLKPNLEPQHQFQPISWKFGDCMYLQDLRVLMR